MPDEYNQKPRRHASPMEKHVGNRIRIRRRLLNLTQSELADRLSITFQQVQKYEGGANRIGAGRLHDLSIALDVPIQYFFDAGPDGGSPCNETGLADDILAQSETLRLVRAFYGIDNLDCRERLLDLCEILALGSQSEQPSSSST